MHRNTRRSTARKNYRLSESRHSATKMVLLVAKPSRFPSHPLRPLRLRGEPKVGTKTKKIKCPIPDDQPLAPALLGHPSHFGFSGEQKPAFACLAIHSLPAAP